MGQKDFPAVGSLFSDRLLGKEPVSLTFRELKALLSYATMRGHVGQANAVVTVSVEIGPGDPVEADFRASIRPNSSMSPRNLAVALICFTVVCLTIGLSFFSMGAWPVLPFVGLELFAVGMAVGYTIRRSDDCEEILVSGTDVTITQRNGSKTRKHAFPRYWAQVLLARDGGRLQPNRLTIGSHGRFVEIGTDITDDDRSELAAELKRIFRTGV